MLAIVTQTERAGHGLQALGPKTPSDEQLVERIANGDKLAMRCLFSRHRARVHNFVLRTMRDATAAEDVVSDVFLEVWRRASRYEGRAMVSTWLLSIARFNAISALRRRREVELDAETAECIVDPADDPEVTLQKSERNTFIRQCLTNLSPEHGQIIDLVYYEDKSVKEVAKIVGISVPTVKSRMFYARKYLAEMVRAA